MIRRPPRSTLFPYTNALPIYDLDPAYPHPVSVHDLQEVRADAEILDDLEPVGRRAAERFSLVRNERRDHFVEHADLVREDELEFALRDLVDLLHLAFSEEPHDASRPPPGDERDHLGVWVHPTTVLPRMAS